MTLAKISSFKISLLILLLIIATGLVLPTTNLIPVKGASNKDWNKDTFWYEPWGISGVHKGVDIFSEKDTDIISPGYGLVLYTGEISLGGKVIISLNSKWRLHYFAHLNSINTTPGAFIRAGEPIGSVGSSGNAAGKQPHLHYSIITLIPYFWLIDNSTQGWKKMFFLNPLQHF